MGTVQDPPVPAESAFERPGSPWPGSARLAGPGGPAGPGYPPAGPLAPNPGGQGRRHRTRLLATTAAVALAAGAGTAWAATASGGTALTTAQIVAKTDPAVVDVVSALGYQGATSSGTGIVLTSSGTVLTNNHVIDGATAIKVRQVSTGRLYSAAVVGYDVAHDIAVLRLKGASGLPTADLGDSSAVKVGAKVVAVGNAGGQDGAPSVATGKVTGLGQSITASDESAGTAERLQGLIRTDAGIEPGDSGGPLINASGQVVGLNTAASSSGNQLSSSPTTQAFTIPIDEAVAIARQIEADNATATNHIGGTAFLGVAIGSSGGAAGLPAGAPAQVAGVEPGSAAAGAGLAAGDTITSLGGHAVTSPAQIRSVLGGRHPGDKISVTWTDQAARSYSATVVLTAGPAG
jgi:S1-C subfamily serine protease